MMLAAFLLALLASHFLFQPGNLRQRLISIAMILALVTVALMTGKDRLLQANSVLDRSGALADQVEESRQKWVAERQKLYPTVQEPDLEEGKRIYEQRCTACHQFDRKKLGPPMNEAVAKYSGDRESLADFLRKPMKVDPNYPAMPNPGLTEFQVKSVVSYLLSNQEGIQ
jgi:cytochrome c551/c552